MASYGTSAQSDRPPRNIVVCCDGTSNEPSPGRANAGSTNVVHIFRCLVKDENQIVFYDPGIGASGILDLWWRRSNRIRALAEQATGYGLDQRIANAYRFICEHYRQGDRIYLFGFSRGAYAARVVAGLIHVIGLLRPEQCNLADFAFKAYKQSSDDNDFRIGGRFSRALGTRPAPIYFLGLWDTVGSLIAPLKDRIGFGLTHLPYTRKNSSVARVRHAMSINERRRLFRLSLWTPVDFKPNRFDASPGVPQDVQQVWFAGGHGDVGGGLAEAESGLAKVALRWMIGEASHAGLRFNRSTVAKVTAGQSRDTGELIYCAADPRGMIHQQPAKFWWAFEYLPRSAQLREWPDRKVRFGFYLPAAEPRPIAEQDWIHDSVATRMADGYAPINLGGDPKRYRIASTREIQPLTQSD